MGDDIRVEIVLAAAEALAEEYSAIPEVTAVVRAGSWAAGEADEHSDLDLYVYSTVPIPIEARARVALGRAISAEVDNRFFEQGDNWVEPATGLAVDVTFRDLTWTQHELTRVLRHHQTALGYTTSVWANVRASRCLFDRDGWFGVLQAEARQPYPEPLRRAIVAKNHPLLRRTLFSYRAQLVKAVARGDWVSVNHRVTALLASYFDILFALNRLPHPGEKRLLALASERCSSVPAGMEEDVTALLTADGSGTRIVYVVDRLVDALDALLAEHGLLP